MPEVVSQKPILPIATPTPRMDLLRRGGWWPFLLVESDGAKRGAGNMPGLSLASAATSKAAGDPVALQELAMCCWAAPGFS